MIWITGEDDLDKCLIIWNLLNQIRLRKDIDDSDVEIMEGKYGQDGSKIDF